MQNRRQFIRTASVAATGLLFTRCAGINAKDVYRDVERVRPRLGGWDLLPDILARIRPPIIPQRDFSILKYGAIADGRTDASAAFRQAIDAAHAADHRH